MRLLLDTHALVWWLTAPEQLAPPARAAIADPTNDVHVSAVGVWELSIKVALGKLPVPPDLQSWLPQQLSRERLLPLPITLEHALGVERLPLHHRDPFDRILIAQAASEEMAIVTRDRIFDQYGVRLLRC